MPGALQGAWCSEAQWAQAQSPCALEPAESQAAWVPQARGERAPLFLNPVTPGGKLLAVTPGRPGTRSVSFTSSLARLHGTADSGRHPSSSDIFPPGPRSFILGVHWSCFHGDGHLLSFESPIEVLAICQLSHRSPGVRARLIRQSLFYFILAFFVCLQLGAASQKRGPFGFQNS